MATTRKRTFGGFAAERTESGFIVHIIDDEGEVFEITIDPEALAQIKEELERLLAEERRRRG